MMLQLLFISLLSTSGGVVYYSASTRATQQHHHHHDGSSLSSSIMPTSLSNNRKPSRRNLTNHKQACQAAVVGHVLETEQSLNVRFYYELLLLHNKDDDDDADVLTAAHDLNQAVADYLTQELILKYCNTSNATTTTTSSRRDNMVANSLRGVSDGGSRILSIGGCTYIQPTSLSTATTTCYRMAGSNTLYLDEQTDIPNLALLERALGNYIQQGFDRGDIQFSQGMVQQVYLLMQEEINASTESGGTRKQKSSSSSSSTTTTTLSGINTTPLAGEVIGFLGITMVALLACSILMIRPSRQTGVLECNALTLYDAKHQNKLKGEGGETSDSDESWNHEKQESDRANPFAPREGQTLVWRNVSMTLSGKGKKQPSRKLLDNVWGEIPAKQTTVIMGSSGAGKTSLLNILAGRARSRGRIKIHADIRLKNYAVDPTNIHVRKMIAFVAQDDSLQITATPREAIWFSAKLRLASSTTDAQLDRLTTQMLSELGLSSCADTMIGGTLLKGISGGERKRTSVGVELVVRPTMVFLDEPTSGLDAFSAVQVCQVLKKVAHAGASVLFTMHQPSSEIFASFDNLILLNLGRVMYQGPVTNVKGFFRRRGYPCPENFNPADWIMNVAQEPIEELQESGFFPLDERDIGDAMEIENISDLRSDVSATTLHHPVGSFKQSIMLFCREMLNIRRDRSILIPRTVMIAILATLVGIIFMKVGATSPAVYSNLQSHFGAIIVIVSMALLATGTATLLTFPDERPVFIREYSTRHYNVVSYFVSRLLVEAMLTATQIFVLVMVCFYMVQFQGSFLYFFSACYALALTSTALGSMIGAATGGNSELSLQFVPILFAAQMIFVGFFITPSLIPEWLRWLRYLSPATYAVRLIVVDEFYQCSSDPAELLNCELLMYNVDADVEHTWWYWLILSIQFFVFRVLALAILRLNARRFY